MMVTDMANVVAFHAFVSRFGGRRSFIGRATWAERCGAGVYLPQCSIQVATFHARGLSASRVRASRIGRVNFTGTRLSR